MKTKKQKFDVTITDSKDGNLKVKIHSEKARKYFTQQFIENNTEFKKDTFEIRKESINNLLLVLLSNDLSSEYK